MHWNKFGETGQSHDGHLGHWRLMENGSKQAILSFEPTGSMMPYGYSTAYFGSMAEARLAVAMLDNAVDAPPGVLDQLSVAGFEPKGLTASGKKLFVKPSEPGTLELLLEDEGQRSIVLSYEQKNGRGGSLIAFIVEPPVDMKDAVQDFRSDVLGFDKFLLDLQAALALAEHRQAMHGSRRRPLKDGEELQAIEDAMAPRAAPWSKVP